MSKKNDSDGGSLPRPDELKKSMELPPDAEQRAQRAFEDEFRNPVVGSDRSFVHLRGLIDHYRQKKCWSIFLMSLMGLMVVFQSSLLGLVGSGVWSFEKYQWLLPALLAQNLAQIVGLSLFVVKALFKDLSSV